MKTTKGPMNTTEGPMKTTKGPMKTTEGPMKTTEGPMKQNIHLDSGRAGQTYPLGPNSSPAAAAPMFSWDRQFLSSGLLHCARGPSETRHPQGGGTPLLS